ncbi:MAG: hypothetical protein JSV37_11035 [Anaerolineaceae bacterium]|nr:MAG: hypothetical protein JSV37_11035 [Anaerolineaceae bacterium]
MKIHVVIYVALLIAILLLQSGCRSRFEPSVVQFTVTTSPTLERGERETATPKSTQTPTPTLRPTAIGLSKCNPDPLPKGVFGVEWQDRVDFEKVPPQSDHSENVEKAIDWLKRHAWELHLAGDVSTISVIAWYDPTLHPGCDICADESSYDCAFAAYLVTDTLWASKALAPYHPEIAESLHRGLMTLKRYGNGLHEVLFHPIEGGLLGHLPMFGVHGTRIGSCVSSGRELELRTLEILPNSIDQAQSCETQVYEALQAFWEGQEEEGRERLREVYHGGPGDSCYWDTVNKVFVDAATRYVAKNLLDCDSAASCFANATFKLGGFLYAVRVMDMEAEFADQLPILEERLWDAQHQDGEMAGGMAHIVLYRSGEEPQPLCGATGEATSIAVLAYTATTRASAE